MATTPDQHESPVSSSVESVLSDDAEGVGCKICCSNYKEEHIRTLECGHTVCRHCLRTIVNLGFQEGQWPPRCCSPLRRPDVEWVTQTGHLLSKWVAMEAEMNIPYKERVYCANPGCGRFLKPESHFPGPPVLGILRSGQVEDGNQDDIRHLATCPVCAIETCVQCHQLWDKHYQQTLGCPDPAEEEDKQFAKAMAEAGWKRCPGCSRVIEHTRGCNHMVCSTCKTEFCFECLAFWEACKCGIAAMDADLQEALAQAELWRLMAPDLRPAAMNHGVEERPNFRGIIDPQATPIPPRLSPTSINRHENRPSQSNRSVLDSSPPFDNRRPENLQNNDHDHGRQYTDGHHDRHDTGRYYNRYEMGSRYSRARHHDHHNPARHHDRYERGRHTRLIEIRPIEYSGHQTTAAGISTSHTEGRALTPPPRVTRAQMHQAQAQAIRRERSGRILTGLPHGLNRAQDHILGYPPPAALVAQPPMPTAYRAPTAQPAMTRVTELQAEARDERAHPPTSSGGAGGYTNPYGVPERLRLNETEDEGQGFELTSYMRHRVHGRPDPDEEQEEYRRR